MRLSLTDLFYFVTDEKQRINDEFSNWQQEGQEDVDLDLPNSFSTLDARHF
jgi:hypothetical protein